MITALTMQPQNLATAKNITKTYEPEEVLIFNHSNNQENIIDAEIETKEETPEKEGGFLNSIKNFFKGVGNFFKNLFSKKDDKETETEPKTETDTAEETATYHHIKANKEDITIDINEKIENFSQGQLGDCWLLSTLKTLSYSNKGAQIIEDAIEKNDDNSYSVTFEGIGATYNVTEEELIEAKMGDEVATGDDDVVLLEIAADKALEDVKTNPDKFSGNDYATYISFLSAEPKHDDKTYKYIDAGSTLDVVAAMFGCDPLSNSGQIGMIFDGSHSDISDKINEIKKLDLDNMITQVVFDTEFLEDLKGADGEDIATVGMHSYSIKSIEGDIITLINPWDTTYETKFNLNDIADRILQIDYCYLD